MDASVLANALIDDGPVGDRSRAELGRDAHWAAPEHLVVETFSAIRGRYLGRNISKERAHDALDALASSTIELLSTMPLLPRMWQLRANVSGYDAAYIVTAETYECPLVTCDARLTHMSELRCEIRSALPTN